MDNIRARAETERWEILETLESWLETPLLLLGIVWLVLLIVEFIWGFSPWLEHASDAIWIIFIIDFAIKFLLAPKKIQYLKENWLTAIALAIPALRIFRIFRVIRIFRAARFARGVRLVRVLTSVNRGLKAIGASFGRRGFSYVLGATTIVLFAGAAGMFSFESQVPGTALDTYSSAVWWTAMMITSIGSDYFPKTAEGRLLCFLIGLYGFMVFGYLTATLATFFVESDANSKNSSIPAAQKLEKLEKEILQLRVDVRNILSKIDAEKA
jgi:voltage-gated potassium channel